MASAAQSSITVEDYVFPPSVRPPASHKFFALAGAGVRGLMIEGKFITFTCSGIYMDVDAALPSLAPEWNGKSADELALSDEFFRDIVTGPYEKFIQTTMIKPLTGAQFSAKVAENCIAIMKAFGTYTEVEEKAIEKFMEIFKDECIQPGFSVYFLQSPIGTLTIAFGKHDVIKGVGGGGVIENGPLSEAFLESIIGKNGVSPATRKSMANRLQELLNTYQLPKGEDGNNENYGEIKV